MSDSTFEFIWALLAGIGLFIGVALLMWALILSVEALLVRLRR